MNRIFTYGIGLFFLFSNLIGFEYAIDAKREGSGPIKKLHVFSERCTGSFYITDLLKNNLSLVSAGYGHKHFPPWFELPIEDFIGPRQLYTFENSDDTLFVILFRNPYSWIKSFHEKPHHSDRSLHHLTISDFIRRPWILKDTDIIVVKERKKNPYLDWDPMTKKPFENVLKLRSAKIRNFLMIKDRVKNIYFIQYETAKDHPHEVIKEVADIYGLTPDPVYKPVVYYKGDKKQGVFKPKKSEPICYDDLLFINQQLDRDLEELIGYKLIYNPWEQFPGGIDDLLGKRFY